MKKKDLNIMGNVKIIESLKAQLIRVIGDFYTLLTRGGNVAEEAIVECISGAIICLLYTSPSPRNRQKSRMPSSA